MKITTRGEYALQALFDLIKNSNGRAVKLMDIATRQNLPLAYLEQLFRKMRIAGIVKSVRGPGGGYIMAKALEDITAEDVLKSVKEITYYTDRTKPHEDADAAVRSMYNVIIAIDSSAREALSKSLASFV